MIALGASSRQQSLGDIAVFAVDVVMGAERADERFLLPAAIDRDRPKAEACGKLNAKMAETAHAMDHDEIAWAGPAVAKSVEGAAVPRHPGRSRAIFASELFAPAATPAVSARPSEPTDACAIADGPTLDVWPDGGCVIARRMACSGSGVAHQVISALACGSVTALPLSASRSSVRAFGRFKKARPAAWLADDGVKNSGSRISGASAWDKASLRTVSRCSSPPRGGGADEDHLADQLSVLSRNQLGQETAEGEARQVDFGEAEQIDKGDCIAGHRGDIVRGLA